MKNILMAFVITIATCSTYAAPTQKNINQLCSGEFSESILESVKACTAEDLARATIAAADLERELISVRNTLAKVQEYKDSGKAEKDAKTEKTILISGGVLSLVAGIPAVFAKNTAVKTAGFITWAIGFAMTYGYLKMGAPLVKYNVEDIPKLKGQIETILEQIRVRRALLEMASQLKANN